MNILSRPRVLLVFLFLMSQVVDASCDPLFQLVVEDKKTHACLVTCKVFNLDTIGLPNICLVNAADCSYAKGQEWPPYIAVLYAAWWIATHTNARAICVQEGLISDSGCASYIAMLPGVNQERWFSQEGIDGRYWSVALEEDVGFFLGSLLNATFDVGSVGSVRELFKQMWRKLAVRMCDVDEDVASYTIVVNWAYN